MRLIKLDEKRNLALKAVVYGCNTNNRLAGSSFMTGIGSDSVETISFYDALSVIDEMMDDTIKAEPVKHGRWKDNGIPESMLSKCSVCDYSCGAYSFNYCPNCGAKMRGDNE